MATIIEFEDNLIWVTCSGSQFQDQIESCKYLKMNYNPSKKKWSISTGKIKEAINNYIDGLSNFHRIVKRSERRHFNLSLMKKPPFVPPSSS